MDDVLTRQAYRAVTWMSVSFRRLRCGSPIGSACYGCRLSHVVGRQTVDYGLIQIGGPGGTRTPNQGIMSPLL